MPKTSYAIATLTLALASLAVPGGASAHCQVPCGIYDDEARIQSIREDVTTIAKAVKSIEELSAKGDAQSLNQAVRWIETKEQHASNIIETVSLYFLTQKVKPPKGDDHDAHHAYHMTLTDHHAVMRAAMKTKQTVSADAVAGLNKAVEAMAAHYGGHGDAHAQPHTQHKH